MCLKSNAETYCRFGVVTAFEHHSRPKMFDGHVLHLYLIADCQLYWRLQRIVGPNFAHNVTIAITYDDIATLEIL